MTRWRSEMPDGHCAGFDRTVLIGAYYVVFPACRVNFETHMSMNLPLTFWNGHIISVSIGRLSLSPCFGRQLSIFSVARHESPTSRLPILTPACNTSLSSPFLGALACMQSRAWIGVRVWSCLRVSLYISLRKWKQADNGRQVSGLKQRTQ